MCTLTPSPWASQVHRLTPEEESACWADRSEANRWRLVQHHLPLGMRVVARMIGWYVESIGSNAPAVDLLMEQAVEGLWEATEKWNVTLGKWSTYAARVIRSRSGRRTRKESETFARSLSQSRRVRGLSTSSLGAIGPTIPDNHKPGNPSGRTGIEELIRARCTPREQFILWSIYWGDMRQKAVGRALGISGERVRQIRVRTLRKLRIWLEQSSRAETFFVDE